MIRWLCLLTVGLVGVLSERETAMSVVLMFFRHMVLGGLIGYSMGAAMAALMRHVPVENDGLYAVLSLAVALFTYGMDKASVGGNGVPRRLCSRNKSREQ